MQKIDQLIGKWQFWAITLGCILILSVAAISLTTFSTPAVDAGQRDQAADLTLADSSAQPVIALSPPQGNAYTTINITGAGWPPGDNLSIFLENPANPGQALEAIATVIAEPDGSFATTVNFPDRLAWTTLSRAQFTVFSSGDETASAIFFIMPVTPTPSPRAVPADIPALITGVSSLRLGPGSAYPEIVALPVGTQITVLGQNDRGSWLFVRVSGETLGWLARDFTDYEGLTTILPTPSVPADQAATPLPSPIPIVDWRGEYWPNATLTGEPTLIRNDVQLDFNWGPGSPDPALPSDNFSARWSRTVDLAAGNYRFHLTMDDGARLWVNGQLEIDDWQTGSFRESLAEILLPAGSHDLVVEFYEANGTASARLWWARYETLATPTLTLTPIVTPTETLAPTATFTPTLTSTPALTDTPTTTPIQTPTLTPTVTLSPTVEPTPTLDATATLTPTLAATSTPTPTLAATPTLTPTQVAPTATLTPTLAATPTLTPTEEPTPTETPTPTAGQPPNAVISGPDTGQVNQPLTFDGGGSQAGSSPISRYDWDFGDGSIAEGANVSHTFSAAGTYTVLLTLTDQNGLTHSATLDVVVQ